jgi:molybdate transport system ATP-binding protein
MSPSSLRPGLSVHLTGAGPIPLDLRFDTLDQELIALVGPSGSGKTTVLRALAGLVPVATGRICFGDDVWLDSASGVHVPPQARRVGFVFQDYALFPHLTARETVALAVADGPPTAKRARADRWLAKVNLEGLGDRTPSQLSGGQQQRVALARALAREPRVLLLDEPFSSVDKMTRDRLKQELARLRGQLSCPILLVTHDLDEALALADRIGVLHRGRLLQLGSPDDALLRPATPTVARLMGQTNIFSGTLEQVASGHERGRIVWAGGALEIVATGSAQAGASMTWMIASDSIVLHRRGRPSQGERENPVSGRIVQLTRLGEQTAVSVAVNAAPDTLLNFRLPTHAARRNELDVGTDVSLSLLAESLHVFDAVGD